MLHNVMPLAMCQNMLSMHLVVERERPVLAVLIAGVEFAQMSALTPFFVINQ